MLNIAYVGFGKSTNRYHIPYLMERQDRFKISRVVTPTLGKRPDEQAALETTGTQFSTDIADILNDDSLDLVVVVTPAPSHYEVAKQLLLAGKNVLVDKPMVETLAQAENSSLLHVNVTCSLCHSRIVVSTATFSQFNMCLLLVTLVGQLN